MALMIAPDGTRTTVQGEGENGQLKLKQLYQLIGCKLVQRVPCDPKETGGYDGCYVDEEGKSSPLVKLNPFATAMCTWIADNDFIVGTAIFVNSDGEGEDF